MRRSVAKCEYYCLVYIFLEKVNKQSAGEQCDEQQLRGEVRTIQYLINIATLHFFRYKHFTPNTDNYNTFLILTLSLLMSQFFPDTQFFVYPIHQTFNNKIFESYSNLYSELFRLENTEFLFVCVFLQ